MQEADSPPAGWSRTYPEDLQKVKDEAILEE